MSHQRRDLANAILRVLGAQKLLGKGSYPLSLKRLGELIGIDEPSRLIRAARTEAFREGAVAAKPGDLNAPVALWEDIDILAADAQLLRYAIEISDSKSTEAHSVAELSRRITSSRDGVLQKAFKKSVSHRLETNDLPLGIGALTIQSRPRLFLLRQIRQAPAAPEEVSGSKPRVNGNGTANRTGQDNFENEFWQTFHRLDVEGGRRNFVSLYKLRNELDNYDRQTFDTWIREMRNHTQISLAATHSGRNLSAEEREAGIQEAGRLLVYVSKR